MTEHTGKTLFGEVALRMAKSPEDIATESLCYILTQYEAARKYFQGVCEQSGVALPDGLHFETQDSGENHRPDMVGIDRHGDRCIIVESKFWAGLTDNQPTTYLKTLPATSEAILLFIVPSLRFRTLWPKLRNIATRDGLTLSEDRDIYSELRVCDVSKVHRMAQVSWRVLVAGMISTGEAEGVAQLVADASQLQGLCERMDGESFLPLADQELSPQIGRRLQQFAELIDDIIPALRHRHGVSTKSLKTGGKSGEYGRFFQLDDTGLFLGISPAKWGRVAETPFWLSIEWVVDAKTWHCPKQLTDALRCAYPSMPMAMEGKTSVPIDVPTGVERDEVINCVCDQIVRAANISNSAKKALGATSV